MKSTITTGEREEPLIKYKIKKTKILIILKFLIVITAGLILYFYKPVKGGIYPPCPFLYLTHYYCPGCGTLRGLHSLLHGDILTALDYNPLMVLSIPFVIYLTLSNLKISINGKLLFPRHTFSKSFYLFFLFVIISFWILRNINIYPFTILAP